MAERELRRRQEEEALEASKRAQEELQMQKRKAAAAGLWPTVQTHPHYAKWLEFAALVADGVTHTRARLGTGKVRASVGGAREQVSSQRITQEQSQHRERKEKKKKQRKKQKQKQRQRQRQMLKQR